jgi:copper oxidase (laccase) domain-containing protein
MTDRFGTWPEDLVVAIGPGIGACCFEVGPEVAVQFQQWLPERQDLSDLSGRTKVDLAETITRQLRRNNVTVGHLATANLCTVCDKHLFHSYRRDREQAGRMISTIRIRDVDQ